MREKRDKAKNVQRMPVDIPLDAQKGYSGKTEWESLFSWEKPFR